MVVSNLDSLQNLEAALTGFLKRAVELGELAGSPLSASIGIYYVEAGNVGIP